jgi:3-phenylpropionate/trans-cinnamate dioxygenase ferredoxin reductase component
VSHGLVVVGGSYAAAQIAASAREQGYAEPIRIVSEEACGPYQRPPLSKGYLAGKVPPAALPLRSEAFYRDSKVELILGARAESIDLAGQSVVLSDGQRLAFDRLALATGARPRPLPVPGATLDGVLFLRSLADADALRARLARANDVVIVGAGFIGLEFASVAVAAGKKVTVVEMQDRALARAVAAGLAGFIADVHRGKGLDIRLGATVRELRGTGKVESVVCGDGTTIPADLVLLAIGVIPNIELAQAAGLACRDGIVVDRFAATSDPRIVSAGDCTRHPSAYADQPLRLESVQNALDQAKAAAATVAGIAKPYEAVPWFWSDQYDLKLQMVGLSAGHDSAITRGAPGDGRFSVFYYRAGKLIAIDSVNKPGEHMLGRKLLTARVSPTAEQASDTGFDLQTLLAAKA